MKSYTIKTNDNDEIFLINQQNKIVPCADVLQVCGTQKVLAFVGPLGAGKTTFIKQLMSELGTDDIVNSPTFAIVNVYESHGEEFYHFDCYRLKDIREAIDLGAEDYLYSGHYCFIEWPEIITPILPEDTIWIHIQISENGDRKLNIDIE